MSPKLIIVIVGVLVLGFIGYFIFASTVNKSPKTNLPPKEIVGNGFDFGDAPDGKATSYEGNFAQTGQFPSLLASNGARVIKTDEVWLGQEVTMEKDSKQVNADEADDGVRGTSTSCKPSTTYFFVGVKNPGQATGTAYLNLYADWNKDGRWAGGDECGQEWAVQNFPIDLAKQTEQLAVYEVQFTAGKNTKDIWYRGSVTLDEKMNETATGEFKSGEIEDFGPHQPLLPDEKYYNFFCQPDPLVINHGTQRNVEVVADFGSEPIFDVEFGQNFKRENNKREVSLWPGNIFSFQSSKKDIDLPKRNVAHFVPLRVRFGADGKEAVIKKPCRVIVKHDEIAKPPEKRPLPVPSHGEGQTKTESPQPLQPETHPIQEGGVLGF